MSWFFGKKKHKDSPPDSPQEPARPEDGEFIFVERRNQQEPNPNDPSSSLYPSLNISSYPSLPVSPFVKQSSQEGPTNYLTNIPFKFCKELERTMNEDLVIDKLRLNEIESFIKRINTENYDYEFNLERSVITEMDSQNEE